MYFYYTQVLKVILITKLLKVTMQIYIKINWLLDININQCTGQFPYISGTNGFMNNYHLITKLLY